MLGRSTCRGTTSARAPADGYALQIRGETHSSWTLLDSALKITDVIVVATESPIYEDDTTKQSRHHQDAQMPQPTPVEGAARLWRARQNNIVIQSPINAMRKVELL